MHPENTYRISVHAPSVVQKQDFSKTTSLACALQLHADVIGHECCRYFTEYMGATDDDHILMPCMICACKHHEAQSPTKAMVNLNI